MQSPLIILRSCLESAYCIILRIILRFKVKSEHTAQKMKFSVKNFFSKCDQIRSSTLVTVIEKIFNGKLHILCSDTSRFSSKKSKCESGINAESREKVNSFIKKVITATMPTKLDDRDNSKILYKKYHTCYIVREACLTFTK